jgi:hypothetical protein
MLCTAANILPTHPRARATALIAVLAIVAISALALMSAPPAHAGVSQWSETFEAGGRGWWTAGNAGFDLGRGLAHTGQGNAWVRNWTGWNAVNTFASARAGRPCTAQAWIRLSSGIRDGYMTVRDRYTGVILNEIRLFGPGPSNPANANYNLYSFNFTPSADSVLFYVGLWGNGTDQWEQIDDVTISCITPY